MTSQPQIDGTQPDKRQPALGLVSTVIPVFNRPERLAEAVASAVAQDYRPIEIVIVDDGSTDVTPQAIAGLRSAHPDVIRSVRQENAGAGTARRTGLAMARGEFVQYLDSDDLLLPGKFAAQVGRLRERPEADVCYGVTRRLRDGQWRAWAQTGEAIDRIVPSFFLARGWDTNCPLWRRSLYDRMPPSGGEDGMTWGRFRVLEDWEHDLRAGIAGARIARVSDEVAVVRDDAADRASGMSTGFTEAIARGFAQTHASVWPLLRDRVELPWSDWEPLARKMFWIARTCGGFGLRTEAEACLRIAVEMHTLHSRRLPRSLTGFRLLRRAVGWPLATRLAERSRRTVQSSLREGSAP